MTQLAHGIGLHIENLQRKPLNANDTVDRLLLLFEDSPANHGVGYIPRTVLDKVVLLLLVGVDEATVQRKPQDGKENGGEGSVHRDDGSRIQVVSSPQESGCHKCVCV